MKKSYYSMGTLPSASPLSKSSVVVGVGVILGQIYIRSRNESAKVAIYDLGGAGGGAAANLNLATFWACENDFESDVDHESQFSGWVYMTEMGSVQFVVGYSCSQTCVWLTGKARGTLCKGGGLSIGLGAGVTIATGTHCYLRYNRLEILPWLINS